MIKKTTLLASFIALLCVGAFGCGQTENNTKEAQVKASAKDYFAAIQNRDPAAFCQVVILPQQSVQGSSCEKVIAFAFQDAAAQKDYPSNQDLAKLNTDIDSSDIKVDGDTATLTYTAKGESQPTSLVFRYTDGSWKFDAGAQVQAWLDARKKAAKQAVSKGAQKLNQQIQQGVADAGK